MFIVLSTKQRMLGSFCPIPKRLTTHLSYHWLLLMKGAPRALIAKRPNNNQSQGREATLLKSPILLPHVEVLMDTNGRVGAWG